MIWYESGGEGSRGTLMLHGLGATAAVWNSVRRALQERGTMRWLAVDLSGHGGSDWRAPFNVGEASGPAGGIFWDETPGGGVFAGDLLRGFLGPGRGGRRGAVVGCGVRS